MTVRSFDPPAAASEQLAQLRQHGCVLHTSFWTYDEGDETRGDETLAKEALLARFDEMLAENAAFRAGMPPGTRTFELRRTGEPTPGRIGLDDLLGPAFDAATNELRLFTFPPDYKARSANDYDHLPRALLNPPYTLRLPGLPDWPKSAEQEPAYHAAFHEALRAYVEGVVGISLLGLDAVQPVVHRWSTEWTNYFDAGREWWGTFCWTIQRPADRVIVVLLASSTD